MIILDNYRVKLMDIEDQLKELASAMRIEQVISAESFEAIKKHIRTYK